MPPLEPLPFGSAYSGLPILLMIVCVYPCFVNICIYIYQKSESFNKFKLNLE